MTDVRPRYQLVGLDCPDPIALATFYSRLTGLEVEPLGDFKPEEVEWIELDNGHHPTIAFQKVPNYVAPTWPTGAVPQQLHLDFLVREGLVTEKRFNRIRIFRVNRSSPRASLLQRFLADWSALAPARTGEVAFN